MKNTDKPEYIELVKRWDAYLQKMEQRFYDLLDNSQEAILDQLQESDFDLNPTTRAWQTMRVQLLDFIQQIDTMFDDKVRYKMEQYVESHEYLDQGIKASELQEKLHQKLERHGIELEGKVALLFYDHAIQFQNEDFNCSQCGGLLKIQQDVFRTHYVTCHYCKATNTFKPNDKVLNVQWTVVDNIAKLNCLPEWENLQAANTFFHSLRDDRPAEVAAMNACEKATKEYWTKFLKERIVLISEYEESFEADLHMKMKSFSDWKKIQLR